jgi:serine/threonine protein phosphatase 1
MLSRFFGSRRREARRYRTPDGTRVYAVGDIHGRVDLLNRLHELIAADIRNAGPDRAVLVYVGDYIDRGDQSRDVLDLLLTDPVSGVETVHLLGNHEAFLLTFMEDPSVGESWLKNGGDATMLSYGVGTPPMADRDERYRVMRDDLENRMPGPHQEFLRSLKRLHVEADYAFVHAGIKPGIPLDDQVDEDLLWIRGEFLGSRADHGVCVVHGHTITDDIEVRPNRIGIDTGAYFSGRLSCLVLDGESRATLQT